MSIFGKHIQNFQFVTTFLNSVYP